MGYSHGTRWRAELMNADQRRSIRNSAD